MESTQDKLLGIAAQLFADQGFAGVSMRQIGRSADLTQAAIYHHFENKQELYIAAVEHVYGDNMRELVSDLGDNAPAEKQVALVVNRLMTLLDERPALHSIYFRELLDGESDGLDLLSQQAFPEVDAAFTKLMQRLAPHMDSYLLMLSLIGLVFHHLQARKGHPRSRDISPEQQDINTLSRHVTTLFLNGALPQ